MPAPGWRRLCKATRRFCAETSAMLEQGLGKALPNKAAVAQQRKPQWGFQVAARSATADGGALPRQALAPTRMTEWTAIFQALKICGHRSILAFALSVQH